MLIQVTRVALLADGELRFITRKKFTAEYLDGMHGGAGKFILKLKRKNAEALNRGTGVLSNIKIIRE